MFFQCFQQFLEAYPDAAEAGLVGKFSSNSRECYVYRATWKILKARDRRYHFLCKLCISFFPIYTLITHLILLCTRWHLLF